MAPAKNPNTINKISGNSNSQNHNNIQSSATVSTNAGNANTTSSSASQRKHTGTVPKTSTKSNASTTTGGQKLLLQSSGVAQMANRCSPLNIVSSVQQHNTRTQQHKNTEIVAPIRRELKDLNDYLLTTVVSTETNNNNNILNNNQQLQQLQTSIVQQQNQSNINTGPTNSDLESAQENQQRFCYPVRPIPRRNQQQSQQHNNQQTQNDFLNLSQNTNLNTAIGVVIPTTPSLLNASNSTATQSITTVQPVTSNTNTTINENSLLGSHFEQHLQLLVIQRLKQLFENSQSQPFLNLTANLLPSIQTSTSANLANAVLSQNANEFNQLAQRFQHTLNSNNNNNQKIILDNTLQNQQKALKYTSMVHEINPNTSTREVVVNSTSLEDVPLSEASDRAQSIQSLHSNMETPTPDNTPSYEELQHRLEASNRNIQNMQDQQQQLLKLQNTAKQHLTDMEKLRQQAQILSFPAGSQRGADGGDGTPEYESIDQVHSDMAALVGRMKNLTSFIHNQNELSSLMGDDGPEILAEQELLQRKLEALRTQRDEMRNLVSELQTVNRSAEETAKEARQRQYEQEKDIEENDHRNSPKVQDPQKKTPNMEREREVPIEVSRNVPIELLQPTQSQQSSNSNGHIQSEYDVEVEDDEEQRKIAAVLIQQKVADIDAMKAQLKRLKDMMETVNIIESHTAKDPKLIGQTVSHEGTITFDRERTPIAGSSRYQDDSSQDEFIARKVRMLNEVTSDLRAQAQSLQSEKDRIQDLKNEIERRKQQASYAAQMGEEALKRNSLTPTPLPKNHENRWEEHTKNQQERDQLKEEYEVKKKEFELICKRLEQEEQQPTPTRRQDIVSEADDEAEEDNNDSDYAASTKFVAASTPAAQRANEQPSRNVKDSLNSTGASSNAATHIAQAASSTHDVASLEAASIQSGSSRSFSIPPPMSSLGMNFAGPIPPPLPNAWNPHQYYYATGVPPPPPPPQASFSLNQATNNTATLSTNECICNANNLGAATSSSTATSAATHAPIVNNEPMLQQFIQTQQMLISSVCQCNQMLWHQQREIDSLNQTIHMLQERIFSLTAGNMNATNNANDVTYGLRSESVPPHSLGGIPSTQALPNNLYVGLNRAQSEQPIPFIPAQNRNSAFSNYQQLQHVYRHQRLSQPQVGYNFSSETQQHNSSAAASSSMYATLNNAAPPQASQAPSTHFNNEIPTAQSPVVGSGPAPIFMHHHNNAIHQNNANLRTQNQQQQQHHPHSNISHTLNNQVPPGNRANNYWDNFRSYSRQNLLSSNSTKSNEEQQMQQQQQETLNFERPTSMPHQQQQHPSYNFHPQNVDECSNNLNYAANNESSNSAQNKYLRIIQRSRINQQHQQQQYQQNIYQQQRDFLQQLNWLEEHENTANTTNNSNAGSNTADLMYHNYNIHQSNKVGPKPNWRFRNVNEEYNTPTNLQQNSRHTAQPLQRYQNTLTLQQQQQQHQRLHHFLNLPQQHQQTTTPAQGRNQDFLLRTAMEIDVGEPNYNFLNTQQQLPLDFSNPQQLNNDNMILNGNDNNEEDDEEEDDDTTSEEIKRNLLVNALKNDKFTTKFYESIKEDVFRRLESMLLDKDNVNNETTVSNTGQQNLHFNNISNISSRKLNLNEQRDQLLQQQQHNQPLQSQLVESPIQNSNEEEIHISVAGVISNESEQPISSSNNDNENENPEEDTNWRQSIINNCNNPNQTAQNSCNNSTNALTANVTSLTKTVTKKRKNLRKQCTNQTNVNATNPNEEDGGDNLRGACSLAAQQHQKLLQKTEDKQIDNKNEAIISSTHNSPKSTTTSGSLSATKHHHSAESDLIKYIINRIRNQTHTNTLINDALLVDVAKLTATVAQNAQPLTHNINLGNNTNNISPKKIYARIKKLSLPKERDEFLRWYQKYLENTLFGNQRHQQHSSDKGKSSTKTANNQQEQRHRQNDLQPATTDDGDLAEADQNCSLNSTGGSCNSTSNKTVNAPYQQTFPANNAPACALMLIKTEPPNGNVEYENNENPDEGFSLSVEDNREPSFSNCSEAANDLKANETLNLTAKEKSDLKCEKPEMVEKE